MSIASERQEVQRLARKYREEGYAVLTDEEAAQVLPDTLRGFVPDLVASKGKEHTLVEVRTKGEARIGSASSNWPRQSGNNRIGIYRFIFSSRTGDYPESPWNQSSLRHIEDLLCSCSRAGKPYPRFF